MKVYRYLTEKELNHIKNGEFDQIGNEYYKSPFNTHKYKKGVKYVHFVKNKKDICYIRTIHLTKNNDYYICTFDIPIRYLITGAGKGFYSIDGWDLENVAITEFAVNAKHLKKEWLKEFVYDKKNPKKHFEIEKIWFKMHLRVNFLKCFLIRFFT